MYSIASTSRRRNAMGSPYILFLIIARFLKWAKIRGDMRGDKATTFRVGGRYEGEPIASIITLFFGKRATYLYGASSAKSEISCRPMPFNGARSKSPGLEDVRTTIFSAFPPTTVPITPWPGCIYSKPVLADRSCTGSDASTIPPRPWPTGCSGPRTRCGSSGPRKSRSCFAEDQPLEGE